MSLTCSIVGGTGFTGGELLRLLVGHPEATIAQVTSRSLAGKPIHRVHPNLRGHTTLTFSDPQHLQPCDVLFLCTPHGTAAGDIDRYRSLGTTVIDLSADFRLRDPAVYERWYGEAHPSPAALADAVYGLPEIHRRDLAGASLISGVGCNATAMNLALMPLARAGLIERVLCDIKVGSSESGAEASAGSHHPVRSRATRTYSPSGHRHTAEVLQALGDLDLDVTVTAIEIVRGVLCTAHVTPTEPVDIKQLRSLYREQYAREPFVRIVADAGGMHRLPDPKIVAGTNHADVGFAIDERSGRVIVLSAIDNLVKGAAGSAIQSMNVARGFEETAGLTFPGIYPS
ncbi:MAG: N-acetyl-gamma-glutamyl-phosphate reductase [Planctomycetota bacterium]